MILVYKKTRFEVERYVIGFARFLSAMKNTTANGDVFLAPGVGFEPTTNWLHIILMFPSGVDYIIIPLGCEALRTDFSALLLADSL